MKKTFTLIEMLIVIVIIGILAAALVPRLQAIQDRARDSKRKADMREISNWLEVYFLSYNIYPPMINASGTAGAGGYHHGYITSLDAPGESTWISRLTWVMASVPRDPLNVWPDIATTGFYYMYNHVNYVVDDVYTLSTRLENNKDPERCAVTPYKYRFHPTIGVQRRCANNAAPTNAGNIYSVWPSRYATWTPGY